MEVIKRKLSEIIEEENLKMDSEKLQKIANRIKDEFYQKIDQFQYEYINQYITSNNETYKMKDIINIENVFKYIKNKLKRDVK